MRTHQKSTLRWARAIVWTGALIAADTPAGLTQAASPPDGTSRPMTPEEINDSLDSTRRSDATRLLAAMGSNTPIDTKVARLIDRLVLRDPNQVQAAITALTMLGPPAVPSIFRRLDDRRDMPVRGVSFENRGPGSFERVRHHGVEKVIDCLDHVLTDISGGPYWLDDEGINYNGLDFALMREEPRSAKVAAWRRFLARSQAHTRPPSKSLPVAG